MLKALLSGQMLILFRVAVKTEGPKSKKSKVAVRRSSNLLAKTACHSLETSACRLTFLPLKVRGIQYLQTGIFPVYDIFLMCVYHAHDCLIHRYRGEFGLYWDDCSV